MDPLINSMPPSPNLLAAYQSAQRNQQNGVVRSSQLKRKHRETLLRTGHLKPIMRGWYRISATPVPAESDPGLETFLPLYLDERLGEPWCLSAESSLLIRLAPATLPEHIVVLAPYGSTTVHTFQNGTRLTIYRTGSPLPVGLETLRGFKTMDSMTTVRRLTVSQWNRQLTLVDHLLVGIKNYEKLTLHCLKENRHQTLFRIWDRLQALQKTAAAEIIAKGMTMAGIAPPNTRLEGGKIVDPAPFESEPEPQKPATKSIAPGGQNLNAAWIFWSANLKPDQFRPNKQPGNLLQRLVAIESGLIEDAYNHLNLCGYPLTKQAVEVHFAEPERAAAGSGWPHLEEHERILPQEHNTPLPGEVDPQSLLALQGYLDALRLVKRTIVRMLEGRSLATILKQDMRGWRLALMKPSAEAGLIPYQKVLRYREPGMRSRMEDWVNLVADESDPSRRGILAFLGLSYLSPWETGNRRMALLILNALNTSVGLPWVAIRQNEGFTQQWERALTPEDPTALFQIISRNTL